MQTRQIPRIPEIVGSIIPADRPTPKSNPASGGCRQSSGRILRSDQGARTTILGRGGRLHRQTPRDSSLVTVYSLHSLCQRHTWMPSSLGESAHRCDTLLISILYPPAARTKPAFDRAGTPSGAESGALTRLLTRQLNAKYLHNTTSLVESSSTVHAPHVHATTPHEVSVDFPVVAGFVGGIAGGDSACHPPENLSLDKPGCPVACPEN